MTIIIYMYFPNAVTLIFEFRLMTLKSQSTLGIITTNVCSKFENNPSSVFWVMLTPFIPKVIQMDIVKIC